MAFWNKLFKSERKSDNPDNTRLLELLDIYSKNYKKDNKYYKDVLDELLNGDASLLFATLDAKNTASPYIPDKKRTLRITSGVNMDGLRIIFAFTDKRFLFKWAKKNVEYTVMKSPDFLKFSEENRFDQVVINPGQRTAYVIARSQEHIKQYTIPKDTHFVINTSKLLSDELANKLITNFKKVTTINSVHQLQMVTEKERSVLLFIYLSINSEKAKKAALNAVQNAQIGEQNVIIDIMFPDTPEESNSEKSLLYKK